MISTQLVPELHVATHVYPHRFSNEIVVIKTEYRKLALFLRRSHYNVTLEYDLRDANEIISWVAVRSYEWSEQVKEWRHEWA